MAKRARGAGTKVWCPVRARRARKRAGRTVWLGGLIRGASLMVWKVGLRSREGEKGEGSWQAGLMSREGLEEGREVGLGAGLRDFVLFKRPARSHRHLT